MGLYVAYDPIYQHPLPEGHRFPMLKYELIPGQLLREGIIEESDLHAPQPVAYEDVLRVHTYEYLHKLLHQTLSPAEQRRIGFPQSPVLTQRELIITQGTIDCALHALQHGVALNVAGGTHHAYADRGEGFCMLNDFAVAAHYLLHHGLVQRILIIDLDVHQGNGTAKIFAGDDRVFTFSMHGRTNYPFHKEQSDLDVPLEDGTNGDIYLQLLAQHLPSVLAEQKPDFAFYLSGVDVLSTDRFGKLGLSLPDCRMRDRYVFEQLGEKRIPVAVSMGGGYSPDVRTIVEAHCATYKEAAETFAL